MNAIALVGALLGAVAGAVIWALVTVLTGYEVGWIAWGVGGLVGLGSAVLGGRGAGVGAVCAILALVSIFAGKVISTQMLFQKALRAEVAKSLSRAMYDELLGDAEVFAELDGEDAYPRFMVERGFTDAKTVDELTEEEIGQFREFSVPMLQRLDEERPNYEEWFDTQLEQALSEIGQNVSITKIVVDELNPIDLVFALLGLATAFRLGSRGRASESSG